MLNSAFDGIGAKNWRLFTRKSSAARSIALNAEIYDRVNNGVYKAGFATTQTAYEEAVRPALRDARPFGAAARDAALSVRRPDHRSRLALIHDACALQFCLCRPLQMQTSAASRTIRTSGGLYGNSINGPVCAKSPGLRPYQAALLSEPSDHKPDGDRASRAGNQFR